MDVVASSPGFWWLKSNKSVQDSSKIEDAKINITSTPKQNEDPSTISSSLREFLEKERAVQSPDDADTDIGSIIEEINKLAAESPLGPYEIKDDELSIEEIMKEAERIYMESSKSFEQLSAHSRTSANLSVSLNDTPKSTPTPKSASPLPLDSEKAPVEDHKDDPYKDESYSDDFTQDEGSEPKNDEDPNTFARIIERLTDEKPSENPKSIKTNIPPPPTSTDNENYENELNKLSEGNSENFISFGYDESKFSLSEIDNENNRQQIDDNQKSKEVVDFQTQEDEEDIQKLQQENRNLLDSIIVLRSQLEETNQSLAKTKTTLKAESSKLTDDSTKKALLEELKDTKETKTALLLQFDGLNNSHQLLKLTYDKLVESSSNLEKRLLEAEFVLAKCRNDLENVQEHRDKLLESESSLTKLLEIEKLQVKSLKSQNEKDARCIQDLNRQVKEMERIIARKHPDSVSALIVAAKSNQGEENLSARKLLEDRIKNLEGEVAVRDHQSSKVFLEVQEKFSEMKSKYESHIEDLELHVNDLKDQLKRKIDTFDVYTQTFFDVQKIPVKEAKDVGVQTINSASRVQVQKGPFLKKTEKVEVKEETHLLATIRGLQTDVINKEKVVLKLQKELDEAKKTNKRLQKEREGNLKNIVERGREFRSYPEKLAMHANANGANCELEEELKGLKTERDKMKLQLCRIEEDYQNLKAKRLFDLSALQQAHEEEISTYMTNITPLQEQLELHQVTISALQEQMRATKEQMDTLRAERDDLYNRLHCRLLEFAQPNSNGNENINDSGDALIHKKVAAMEQKYQERECRLRAIVHGLSHKNVGNHGCQQCVARQQQLILYKTELDQLLATLRTLA